MSKPSFSVGDRVYAQPYNCFGVIVKVQWQEKLNLRPDLAIPEGFIYWVKLEGKELKPRGFSSRCLRKDERCLRLASQSQHFVRG